MNSRRIWSRDPNDLPSWLGAGSTILGFGLPLWLLLAPTPTATILNILAPLAAVLAVRLQPGLTIAASRAESGQTQIHTLWYMPCLVLALRTRSANLVDGLAPMPLVALLALAMLATVMWVEPAARRWGVAIVAVLLAWSWAWGALVGLNVRLDRSPPRIVSGQVVETSVARGFRYLTIQAGPGPGETFTNVITPHDVFDRHPRDARVCLAIRPGALRWPHVAAIDCPPGALPLN